MDVKLAGIIALPIVLAILIIDVGLNITQYFVIDGAISKTAIWTLIGSFTGAIVSFFLLVLWDKYKDHKSNKQKDEIILSSIGHELEACLFTCNKCVNFLEKEIEVIENKNSNYILPPPVPSLNIWELLKYHIPAYIKDKPDTLLKLRFVVNDVEHFNNQLRSRQDFHINSKALNGFNGMLKSFDESLSEELNASLLLKIKPLKNEFAKFMLDKRSK